MTATTEFDPRGFLPTLALEPGSLARAAGLAVSTARQYGGRWLVCEKDGQFAHYAAHQMPDAERNGWNVVAIVTPPEAP